MSDKKFKPGDIVEHKLNKDYLIILFYDESMKQYWCRRKDMTMIELYECEIEHRKQK